MRVYSSGIWQKFGRALAVFYAIGLFTLFYMVNYWNNNLAIWSHCLQHFVPKYCLNLFQFRANGARGASGQNATQTAAGERGNEPASATTRPRSTAVQPVMDPQFRRSLVTK